LDSGALLRKTKEMSGLRDLILGFLNEIWE